LNPPNEDQIELTVIGPGFGESILVHVGYGSWIVIDCCIDSQTNRPAPLTYLEEMGVDPARAIRLVLATHWHDDHIGGLADLLEVCPAAAFACSAALMKDEYLGLLHALNKRPLARTGSGINEIYRVFNFLRARRQYPRWALANKCVTRIDGAPKIGQFCELIALSPSDAEYARFLQAMASLMPKHRTRNFRIPDIDQNDLSVAAWVRFESDDILLGADLEEHGRSDRGWTAVISSAERPKGRAAIFKIAHHGSKTGHHDGIWTALLASSPVAVLTPWNRGKKLPKVSDRDRIMRLTTRGFATSRLRTREIRYAPAIARTLRESGITIRGAEPPTGYVQLRRSADPAADWTVTLSAHAVRMKDVI